MQLCIKYLLSQQQQTSMSVPGAAAIKPNKILFSLQK
jgi:hypothetical protein